MSKIGATAQSIAHQAQQRIPEPPTRPLRGRRRRRVVVILVGVTAVVIAFASGGIYYWRAHTQPSVPQAITNKQGTLTFPLFYPQPLPSGYRFDPSQNVSGTSDAIFYKLHFENKELIITEQAKPKDFDFAGFYQEQLSGETNFTTSVGKATFGSFGGGEGILVSVEGSKTWLIIQAPQGIDIQKLEELLRNLKEI